VANLKGKKIICIYVLIYNITQIQNNNFSKYTIILLMLPLSFAKKNFSKVILLKESGMVTHFVVHEPDDSVGVIVVEGVKKGDKLNGWVMDGNQSIEFETLNDIPIGHKIALKDMAAGDTVIKYGTDIGKVVQPIKRGEHLHVHNVKTKKW
jgi:(2R)-sulfolactate sulfo-lyase subunit alpha